MTLILQALQFAADRHRDQRRKDCHASPYINHPIAVAEVLCVVGGVHDAVAIAAGILHDTIEDTETTAADIEARFGQDISRVVEEVTDDKTLLPPQRKQLQIDHAHLKSERARLVKLADKICNVRDIVEHPPHDWPVDRKRQYVAWARAVVDRIRGSNLPMEEYFDVLCARADAHLAADAPE
ncbi:MAG: HD domain-containing protein [Acidiferrobacterales bacterium]